MDYDALAAENNGTVAPTPIDYDALATQNGGEALQQSSTLGAAARGFELGIVPMATAIPAIGAGAAAGELAGGAIGGAIGSVVPVAGTAAGAAVGSTIGGFVGGMAGGFAGAGSAPADPPGPWLRGAGDRRCGQPHAGAQGGRRRMDTVRRIGATCARPGQSR